MRNYLVRRLLLIIPTLFLASLVVFFVVRLIPGSTIDMMLQEHDTYQTQMDRAALEKVLGLDVPIQIQYVRWLGNIIRHGDLGKSLWRNVNVTDAVMERLPVTFELSLMAIIIAMMISLPVGIYSAIRQDTWGDYVSRSFAIMCIAIPSFWLGTMVMVFPALWWGWSPPLYLIHFTKDPLGNLGMFIVPAIILGMGMSGSTMRMTRTMMLEVLRQDYVRTAWSKGLGERTVVVRHALKNALIPVVTIIGMHLPALVGGTVVMEQIFSLPGMGRLMLDGVSNRDYPIVSGAMLFFALAVLLANILVDISYAFLDPRVHYG